jgi:NYN domain
MMLRLCQLRFAKRKGGNSRKSDSTRAFQTSRITPSGITFEQPSWHKWGGKAFAFFSRPLRYRNQIIRLPNGLSHTFLVGQEKGVDVRLALDIVSLAYKGVYDIALVMSQDQDLSEVADEVREIARQQNRWLKMASAFPASPASQNRRGINGTDWIKIDRATYDACIDLRDYRPKAKS